MAAAAYATPQSVAGDISPSSSPTAGFSTSYLDKYQITAVSSTIVTKRDLSKVCDFHLTINLLHTDLNSAMPAQLPRDLLLSPLPIESSPTKMAVPYTLRLTTKSNLIDPRRLEPSTLIGSVGSNSSLALGSSAIFYECLSGGFYSLYDRHWVAQCEPILIDILPCGTSSSGEVTQASGGQPAATSVTTAVSQIFDGQPQAQSAKPITQISDGQPQAASPIPITQISDGQPQVQTAVISQISDGQPQAPTATATAKPAPMSQISDGQP